MESLGKTVVNAVDVADEMSETSAQKMEITTETIAGLAALHVIGPGYLPVYAHKGATG